MHAHIDIYLKNCKIFQAGPWRITLNTTQQAEKRPIEFFTDLEDGGPWDAVPDRGLLEFHCDTDLPGQINFYAGTCGQTAAESYALCLGAIIDDQKPKILPPPESVFYGETWVTCEEAVIRVYQSEGILPRFIAQYLNSLTPELNRLRRKKGWRPRP
jgi:hypothetical protein